MLPHAFEALKPILSDEDMDIDSDMDPQILESVEKLYQRPNYFDMGSASSSFRLPHVA